MKRLGIIDVSNLAYKALYTTGHLSQNGEPTGVIYGFWKSLMLLGQTFGTDSFAFAFDSGNYYRKEILPSYKGARKASQSKEDPEAQEARKSMYAQIQRLREELLPGMGFPDENIGWANGYEADDVIASYAKNSKDFDRIYIVSSDEDLFQLLETRRVYIWKQNVKEYFSEQDLFDTYQISPVLWPSVKAWAGCDSDSIPGLPGVGNKTAAKFLRGQLKNKIERFTDNLEVYNRNVELTRLPFKGCPVFRAAECTGIHWDYLGHKIGARVGSIDWSLGL